MIGELIVRCFHARTNAHILHFQTRSYATHKALNEFYDEIVDLADALAEAWIGEEGEIPEFAARYTPPPESGLKLVEELAEWIEKNRDVCGDASHLQNTIDEIVSCCRTTAYKLRFLK